MSYRRPSYRNESDRRPSSRPLAPRRTSSSSRSRSRDRDRRRDRSPARPSRTTTGLGYENTPSISDVPWRLPTSSAAASVSAAESKTHSQRVPVSLEELMKQREEAERQAQAKPVFLTKEQRAELALQRRQQEVEEKKKREAEEQARRQAFQSQSQSQSQSQRSQRGQDQSQQQQKDLLSERVLDGTELHLIKSRYMGTEFDKRKVRKVNERRFVFDWDEGEDTSVAAQQLHLKPEAPLFGRGRLGGMDLERPRFQSRPTHRPGEEGYHQRSVSKRDDERHWRDKNLEEMASRDWRIFREDFNISTKGGNIPLPLRNWDEAAIPMSIKMIFNELGYTDPTPIQRQAIPIGLQNRDMIGVAETGSGKTCAFLVPMLVFIMELPRLDEHTASEGPYALILAPTRELAQQIERESLKFARPLGFHCVSLVGGHSVEEQILQLRNGAEIIIATPGRLRDCLTQRILVLNQCTYVVMDEADRMVDMGFEEDVNFILDALPVRSFKPDTEEAEDARRMVVNGRPAYRQTTMFSATMPPQVESIARKYLRRPAVVTIGTAGQIVDTVEQRVEMMKEERKRGRLLQLLEEGWPPPMIVFVNQKKNADVLARALDKSGYRSVVLHGGKAQDSREIALKQLRNGERDILVATDVAGRGIDIQNVSLVVNYDMAKTIEDYTHRIGRTGRAGKSGVAVSFVTQHDSQVFYDLKQALMKSAKSICPDELANHEDAQSKPGTAVLKRKHEETLFNQ